MTVEVTKSSRPMTIESYGETTVWQNSKQQIRAKVCAINGYLRVGVSKFFRNRDDKFWVAAPKGGHLYIDPEQWRCLAQHTGGLTQMLKKAETKRAAASSGMRTLYLANILNTT